MLITKSMHRIFLFGEAEKGRFCTPFCISHIGQLLEILGHPPCDTQGISYAIQALLFKRELLFFRIEQEGFSKEQYLRGIDLLNREGLTLQLTAVGLPGVGDKEIIEAITPFCITSKSLLVLTQGDLFDYLTSK